MTDLAVLIGIISFPGLIATVIFDTLLVHAERWDSFRYGIYAFIFGVGSYASLHFLAAVLWLGCVHLPFLAPGGDLEIWSTASSGRDLQLAEVAWATALSPFIALAAAFCVNKKYLIRFAQRWRISNKYGDENLFSYFLNSPDVMWIYLRDPTSGFSYRGMVQSFSETKEVQEITLTDVTVYSHEDSEELYQLRSIYLSKPPGAFTIESPTVVERESNDGRQEDPVTGRK